MKKWLSLIALIVVPTVVVLAFTLLSKKWWERRIYARWDRNVLIDGQAAIVTIDITQHNVLYLAKLYRTGTLADGTQLTKLK